MPVLFITLLTIFHALVRPQCQRRPSFFNPYIVRTGINAQGHGHCAEYVLSPLKVETRTFLRGCVGKRQPFPDDKIFPVSALIEKGRRHGLSGRAQRRKNRGQPIDEEKDV
jgi:hypothetical protein